MPVIVLHNCIRVADLYSFNYIVVEQILQFTNLLVLQLEMPTASSRHLFFHPSLGESLFLSLECCSTLNTSYLSPFFLFPNPSKCACYYTPSSELSPPLLTCASLPFLCRALFRIFFRHRSSLFPLTSFAHLLLSRLSHPLYFFFPLFSGSPHLTSLHCTGYYLILVPLPVSLCPLSFHTFASSQSCARQPHV